MQLPVTNIQRFSTHDGPGIRTTVFLKGCPLRCEWCHNPETQSCNNQIFFTPQNCIDCGACIAICPNNAYYIDEECMHRFDVRRCNRCLSCTKVCPTNAIESVSQLMSVEEIIKIVLKDTAFYGDNGGITLSGGEPLLHIDGCLEILRYAKQNGLSTAIETCGFFDETYIEELAKLTDLFLWDFKDGNSPRHKKHVGVSNEKILQNLFLTDKQQTKILLRCIMVKGVNMNDSNYFNIAKTVFSLKNCIGVELIPYHVYGSSKNKQLGYEENGRNDWIPSTDDLLSAKERLHALGCKIIITL